MSQIHTLLYMNTWVIFLILFIQLNYILTVPMIPILTNYCATIRKIVIIDLCSPSFLYPDLYVCIRFMIYICLPNDVCPAFDCFHSVVITVSKTRSRLFVNAKYIHVWMYKHQFWSGYIINVKYVDTSELTVLIGKNIDLDGCTHARARARIHIKKQCNSW